MASEWFLKCLCPVSLCRCWSKHEKPIGDKQSPIDIRRTNVQQDPMLNQKPLQWSEACVRCTQLINTGTGWEVSVAATGPNLCGGPFFHNYQLEQFHAHWSDSSATGSEHSVDGRYYAGELHSVHYNADTQKSFAEATRTENGLQVVGVFLKEGSPHPELSKIVNCLPYVAYKGQKCSLQQPLDVSALLPTRSSYWTYEGSLTTPPWCENVTWILYKEAIEVSSQQLQAFRQLTSHGESLSRLEHHDCLIVKNTRDTQPLKGRVVREPVEELAADYQTVRIRGRLFWPPGGKGSPAWPCDQKTLSPSKNPDVQGTNFVYSSW